MSNLWDGVEDKGDLRGMEFIDSTNIYMRNPIKGMELISDIIKEKISQDKNRLEVNFEKFEKFLKSDFIKFSNQIAINNEIELYDNLLNIRNEILDSIRFSELANKTHIGIGGSFSSGKSSFLNSILNNDIGDDILPVDSVPTTSIPTYLVQKKNFSDINEMKIYIFNKTATKIEVDRDALLAISHEFYKIYNFGLVSIIDKIVINIASMPYENIAFIDTPGYSKADGEIEVDKNIAQQHLQGIDSMIWLIDVDNGTIRDGDIEFIKSLDFKGDILFVLNKADKKPLNDLKKIIQTIKETLSKIGIDYIDVVAYSSHDKVEFGSINIIDKL
jgi:GTP-binding protein EngB required for normal cell division